VSRYTENHVATLFVRVSLSTNIHSFFSSCPALLRLVASFPVPPQIARQRALLDEAEAQIRRDIDAISALQVSPIYRPI